MRIFSKLFFLLFALTSCSSEHKTLDQVPKAHDFWIFFVESYESGEKKKILNCFSEPHSEIIKVYAERESELTKFIREILRMHGEEGIKTFNDHNVIGGSVFTWPSTFSDTSPAVLNQSSNGFILDDFGWRLIVKRGKDGQYRITNADTAFGEIDVDRAKRDIDAYKYGRAKLSDESMSIEDIPNLRDEMFEKQLDISREDFRRM